MAAASTSIGTDFTTDILLKSDFCTRRQYLPLKRTLAGSVSEPISIFWKK